jgi:hypothetical protein
MLLNGFVYLLPMKGRVVVPPMVTVSYNSGLPNIINRKLYKTGQTRGADNDEIYQNRVSRDSTVLIPYSQWPVVKHGFPAGGFHRGFIVFASPAEYFELPGQIRPDLDRDLVLGSNFVVFYRSRADWNLYNPQNLNWLPATSRLAPVGGQYIARVPNTTNENDRQEFHGFIDNGSGGKGAGIRFFEYASPETLTATRYQLSYLIWHTAGIEDVAVEHGCGSIAESRQHVVDYCEHHGLADHVRLSEVRVMRDDLTVCPLCLQPMLATDFVDRLDQQAGREVLDLTCTKANLFHVEELRPGLFNHRTYNLGWGHHHCNTVVGDMGITGALHWMQELLCRNGIECRSGNGE